MRIFFLSGLPRSGSTLLANILAQNPGTHATATSGMLDVMFMVRNRWDGLIEHKAMDKAESDSRKRNVLLGILAGYHGHVNEDIVFDKSRGHLAHIEMLEWVLGDRVNIIATVRDIPEILASMELRWRDASRTGQVEVEKENYVQMQTVQGRSEVWMRPGQVVGLSMNRLRDAVMRGYGDRIHLVEFDDLTNYPDEVLDQIYQFTDIPHFEHDFGAVIQSTQEDDRVHDMDLHKIRRVVAPIEPRALKVLGQETVRKYSGLEFWR